MKHDIISHLESSKVAMQAILAKVAEDSFQKKPNQDSWSIAEVIEHVIIVESGILGNLQKLAKENSTAILEHPPTTAEVITKSLSREVLATAPEIFIPKSIFKDKAIAMEAFLSHRENIAQFLKTTTIPLINISFPHPRFGLFNGENWMAFMAGHCLRHVEQIKSIISSN